MEGNITSAGKSCKTAESRGTKLDIVMTEWVAPEGTALLVFNNINKLKARFPAYLVDEIHNITREILSAATERVGLIKNIAGGQTLKGEEPLGGTDPLGDRPLRGTDPLGDRPVTGTDPLRDRPLTGTDPLRDRPLTGSDPIEGQTLLNFFIPQRGQTLCEALWDIGECYKTGLAIDMKRLPLLQMSVEICDYLNRDILSISTYGSEFLICNDGHLAAEILRKNNINAAVIGCLTETKARILDYGNRTTYIRV